MNSQNNLLPGSRFNIWKQDPTVIDLGVRKTFIYSKVNDGPSDSQLVIDKLPLLSPDSNGDFLFDKPDLPIIDSILDTPPVTKKDEDFDAAHTYAVVRQVLNMYERLLDATIKWAWNIDNNTDPLKLSPHDNKGKKAFYDRTLKAIKFEYFYVVDSHPFFSCRSSDIVSHETGHAILDALKPKWGTTESGSNPPPQAGALHESIGDLTSIFYILSQFDLVDYIIVETKSDLHFQKNILATWSEQLKDLPDIGPRNADNNLTIQQAGFSVHKLSQVFTGAIYDCLSDIFEAMRDVSKRSDAESLYLAGRYMFKLLVDSILDSPDDDINFAILANIIIKKAQPEYQDFIKNHFKVRDILVDDLSPSDSMNMFITEVVEWDYSGTCATFNRDGS